MKSKLKKLIVPVFCLLFAVLLKENDLIELARLFTVLAGLRLFYIVGKMNNNKLKTK